MSLPLNDPIAIFLVIMAVILLAPLLFERLRLPGIVGVILIGMLIGPNVLNLLAIDNRIEFLSEVGLVYLMFNAGLEVDIHQFSRVGWRAAVFGGLTFLFPMAFGMGLGFLLGMGWLGAILLGSAFSSHTLIAFPILARLGVTRNEAVSVTAGATVLTDIGAFIVLAVVLGVQGGSLSLGYFLRLFLLLGIFAVLVLFGLPRLSKWIFQHLRGRSVEFQFILFILFVSAVLAQVVGVHAVVGAFLAGLAINAALPHHSPVVGRVLFVGESFFIPAFLLSSGMMTDPTAFLSGPRTLLVAAGVTLVAYLSKFVAAWVTGRLFHYSRDELGAAYGLSHAQAAVTIPTLVIGMQIGLFDETLFNAAILMILLTSISSPLMVQHFGPRLRNHRDTPEPEPLFSRILVPIVNPNTQQHLIGLGAILARSQQGKLLALHVAIESHGRVEQLNQQRELLERVAETLSDPEVELELIRRVDESAAHGIIHSAIEHNATLILMGWRGHSTIRESAMGTVLDEVIWESDLPVLVGRITTPLNSIRRVVMALPSESLSPGAVRRTLDVVLAIANALNVPLLVLTDPCYKKKVEELIEDVEGASEGSLQAVKGNLVSNILNNTTPQDLIVLPSIGSRKRFESSLGELPERLAAVHTGSVMVLHYKAG